MSEKMMMMMLMILIEHDDDDDDDIDNDDDNNEGLEKDELPFEWKVIQFQIVLKQLLLGNRWSKIIHTIEEHEQPVCDDTYHLKASSPASASTSINQNESASFSINQHQQMTMY